MLKRTWEIASQIRKMSESVGWPEIGSHVEAVSADWMVTPSGLMVNVGLLLKCAVARLDVT